MPTKISPVFETTRGFIERFVAMDDAQLDFAAIWAMGTWTFSPAAPAMPYTYPYMYLTGPSGSGKTTLGNQVLGAICRGHEAIAGATGPSLFRLMGDWDKESGEVIAHYNTIAVDEIDATYNGAKDESLRQMFNIGYKLGTTVPRSAGKVSIRFPVFGPKIIMGINNGHLPLTVTNRCIIVDMRIASADQVKKLESFYPWNVDEPAAELREKLAQWAKDNAGVLRSYDPKQGTLKNRQWEISRSLVQLAHAAGIEKRIRDAIVDLFTRSQTVAPIKVRFYRAIMNLFDSHPGMDCATNEQLRTAVTDAGIDLSSKKMFTTMLAEDGISPIDFLNIRDPQHPAYQADRVGSSQRGFWRNRFDDAFVKYLADEDDE